MAARATTPELGADRGERRQGRPLLRDARLWLVRRGQRRGRPHRPSRKNRWAPTPSRAARDRGLDQARRHSAARRALSARRGAGRRGPLRLPQHQRQCGDRRADRLRQPRDPVRHRARLGGRVRDFAGGEDLRQSRNVSPHGRRHGRRRRPDHGRRGRAGRGRRGDPRPRRRSGKAGGHSESSGTRNSS